MPSTPLLGSDTRPLFFTSIDVQFSHHSFVPSKFDSANSLAVLHGGFLDFSLRLGVFISIWYNMDFFVLSALVVVLSSASFLRNVGGRILVKTGNHCVGVLFTFPLTILIALLSCVSIFFVCVLLHQT
uniref:Transmembrane protein n=1 Tax=Sipha flava TaxID=143950 RepID=A0A2S2QEE3_9HEMI